MLDIADLIQTDSKGRGVVNILAADRLMNAPQLYATFLLWLLSELFEDMPEVGDVDKPKLVFFFDEAHLLFADAPPGLLQKIEQTVKLIRSKGVGVFFVTQNPLDIPESVLAQLGNRVQHALRAYTPRDQKAVRTAATTFRANPKIDTEKAITELGKGEALVSMLDVKAVPAMVERVFIRPPSSQLGPVTPEQRKAVNVESPVAGKYDTAVDRESAYEKLGKRAEERASVAAEAKAAKEEARAERAAPRERESATDRFVKNVASSVGRQLGTTVARSIGNALIRGILGGLTRR